MGDEGMQAAANKAKEEKKRNDIFLVACSRGLQHDAENLISMGVNLSWKDKGGATAMHFAAAGGYLGICRLLVSKGAEVECEDRDGRSPLHLAVLGDHTEVVDWLLQKGAWTEAYDSGDNTALHCAAKSGSVATVGSLLKGGAKPSATNRLSLTPLAVALLRGRMDIVKALSDSGGASLADRPRGYPLLHLVASSGGGGALEPLRFLLDKGANPNELSSNGLTALHCAAAEGNLKEAEILLKHGADASLVCAEELLSHDMVPSDRPDKPKLELETLRAALKKAAGNRASKPSSGGFSSNKGAGGEAAAAESRGALRRASTAFSALPEKEQRSKVKSWAGWSEKRLQEAPELNSETVRRLQEVKRMLGVLELHSCVLELHRDADFQADARASRVVQAIEAVRADPARVPEYQEDAVVMGVLLKLKRFQDLLRSQGNVKPISLQELVLNSPKDLAETEKRHQAIEAGCERTLRAAVAAASCVTAEQSREAAEAALLSGSSRGGNEAKAAAAADDAAAGKSREEAELDALFPEQKPMSWRDVMMYFLRIIIAGVVSIVLAKIAAANFVPELEEAAARIQKLTEEQPQQPSDKGPLGGGPFGDEL